MSVTARGTVRFAPVGTDPTDVGTALSMGALDATLTFAAPGDDDDDLTLVSRLASGERTFSIDLDGVNMGLLDLMFGSALAPPRSRWERARTRILCALIVAGVRARARANALRRLRARSRDARKEARASR